MPELNGIMTGSSCIGSMSLVMEGIQANKGRGLHCVMLHCCSSAVQDQGQYCVMLHCSSSAVHDQGQHCVMLHCTSSAVQDQGQHCVMMLHCTSSAVHDQGQHCVTCTNVICEQSHVHDIVQGYYKHNYNWLITNNGQTNTITANNYLWPDKHNYNWLITNNGQTNTITTG